MWLLALWLHRTRIVPCLFNISPYRAPFDSNTRHNHLMTQKICTQLHKQKPQTLLQDKTPSLLVLQQNTASENPILSAP